MSERNLVTIREISRIIPIKDADNIELAVVDGWQCVVKKGEFSVGDKGVYFEIDSFLDTSRPEFAFLDNKAIVWDGKRGARIRTMKLRGQISQGLLIPMSKLDLPHDEGIDLSEHFGVLKWEPSTQSSLSGQAHGSFPALGRKTDEERIQNCMRKLFAQHKDEEYEVTLKLDGSSMSVYKLDGHIGVCSRNLELKINEENKDNVYIKYATSSGLLEYVDKHLPDGLMIQAELMGPKIQKNRESLKEPMAYVFKVYDMHRGEYLIPSYRLDLVFDMCGKGVKIAHVPVIERRTKLPFKDIEEALAYADRPSLNNKIAEGVVFKSYDSDFSFKIINNRFLLKEE